MGVVGPCTYVDVDFAGLVADGTGHADVVLCSPVPGTVTEAAFATGWSALGGS